MIITGHLPWADERALRRRGAMEPYFPGAESARHYVFTTCSIIWDAGERRLTIAADPDIPDTDEAEAAAADDWLQVVEVLRMAGRITGDPWRDDIGEPCYDPEHRIWIWDLTLPGAV